MPYLAAAVVLVGVVCLLNLALTLGIIRRMRTQADPTGWPPRPPTTLTPGASIGEFTAVTTDGETISRDTLTGVVGFFSAGCEACHELLPSFAEHARAQGRENVLAVVGGHDEPALAALSPVSRVILADLAGGPVAAAFQNVWTPALYLIGADHRVAATGARMHDVTVPEHQ